MALLLVLAGCSASGHNNEELQPTVTVATQPICYDLTLSTWMLADRKGKTRVVSPESHWQMPQRIRLDTVPLSAAEREQILGQEHGLAVRPEGVNPAHWLFAVGSWTRLTDGSIEVLWNAAYGGVELRLSGLSPIAHGEATVYTDKLDEPQPKSQVVARQFPCKPS